MKEDITEIKERLSSIDTHLAVYNEQLSYHIKRTDLLEKKIEPIDKHVHRVESIFWFVSSSLIIFVAIKTLLK